MFLVLMDCLPVKITKPQNINQDDSHNDEMFLDSVSKLDAFILKTRKKQASGQKNFSLDEVYCSEPICRYLFLF